MRESPLKPPNTNTSGGTWPARPVHIVDNRTIRMRNPRGKKCLHRTKSPFATSKWDVSDQLHHVSLVSEAGSATPNGLASERADLPETLPFAGESGQGTH
jgi:hypothetical protein